MFQGAVWEQKQKNTKVFYIKRKKSLELTKITRSGYTCSLVDVEGNIMSLWNIWWVKFQSWLTQLMGELLTQDGHRGTDALENRGSEGGANGQAIDKVVQAIAQRDHPG